MVFKILSEIKFKTMHKIHNTKIYGLFLYRKLVINFNFYNKSNINTKILINVFIKFIYECITSASVARKYSSHLINYEILFLIKIFNAENV